MQTCASFLSDADKHAVAAAVRHCKVTERLTCLRRGDEGRVSLAVLPVDVQVWTLRQRYDDVHVALVARHQQPYLEGQEREEGGSQMERGEHDMICKVCGRN